MEDGAGHTATDVRHHTARIKSQLAELAQHAREDVKNVEEPHARALFETTAEVLEGLKNAYDHYEQRSETAWKG